MILPEVVTVRGLVLTVVVLLAVVVLLPTVRAYVNQTGELHQLHSELTEAQSRRDELQVELGRWEDRSYVIKQARDRLNFVMPGDHPWRVLDPQTVPEDIDPATGDDITNGPVRGYSSGTPWYQAIWESMRVADRADVAPQPSGTPSPSGAATPSGSAPPAATPSPSK